MLRQIRRFLRNPAQLLGYAIRNPKTIAVALLVAVALIAVAVVSLRTGLLPRWLIAFAVVPVLAWIGYRQWKRVRLLVRVSEEDSGSVTSGPVKVTGRATAAVDGDTLTSTMTDTDCLAYRYKERIDRDPNDGDSLDDLTAGQTTERAVPFYVEDSTGSVLIDTNNADLELTWDETSRGTRRDTFEAYLQDGDRVQVYGTAMAPEKREPPGMIDAVSDTYDTLSGRDFDAYAENEDLVVTKAPEEPYLIVSDRPGWRLLGRQVLVLTAVVALAVGALAIGVMQATGIVAL